MNEIGNAYYQAACSFFEEQQYEKAVENFIKAYTLGVYREEILENLYACFITPNEAEFRHHYEENSRELLNLSYDELEIDFIPVSDTKYYLFYRPTKEFIGSFQLDDEPIMTDDVKFESILIADCWDFRQMLPVMKESTWSAVYILLNEQRASFASFLKLPRFRELYLDNVIIFEYVEIMRLFFLEYPDFYLPKKVLPASDGYDNLLKELHEKRIADLSQKRENVFLSICIPSYNRGAKALAAVQEICKSYYDSEIEIIVSDNDSTAYTEQYQAIREMKDARVRYHRNECNVGFLENVMRLLDMAKGKYAVLSSDEDVMFVSNLPYYMNLLKKNGDCGAIWTSGMSGNFGELRDEHVRYTDIIDKLINALNVNYITGLCYNMDLVRRLQLTEFIRQRQENQMVLMYPHCVMNLKLALISDIFYCGELPLWLAGEAEVVDGTSPDRIKEYMTIDSREQQFADAIKIFIEIGTRGELLCYMYMERCWKFYHLLYLARKYYPSYYEERHITWEDTLKDAVNRSKKYMELIVPYTTEDERAKVLQYIDDEYQKIEEGEFDSLNRRKA